MLFIVLEDKCKKDNKVSALKNCIPLRLRNSTTLALRTLTPSRDTTRHLLSTLKLGNAKIYSDTLDYVSVYHTYKCCNYFISFKQHPLTTG